MRTNASPGPGRSMVNSSTTPGCPGSRAITPRATIDPLPLLADDSATGLLLSSTTSRLTISSVGLTPSLAGILTYLPVQRIAQSFLLGLLPSGRLTVHPVRSSRPAATSTTGDGMRGGDTPWPK